MTLRFKPKNKQVRIIFTDGPDRVMPEHTGKVFAVIGPFDCFADKQDLQHALEILLRSYNLDADLLARAGAGMTDWDSRFLDAARLFASWSKDPSTKVGAVIVNRKRCIIGTGYNGFARGVRDLPERLTDRPTKHAMTVHAEANAILNAVASVEGATIYCTHFPCQDCAKFIIQAGIARVVAPDGALDGWEKSQDIARTMFAEAGVEV